MGDERDKKSWRERDAQRDRSGGKVSRRDPDERLRERASTSAAYSKYKKNLDKLFVPGGGAELPEWMREKLGPSSEDDQAKRVALDELKKSPSAETLRAFLGTREPLPEDARLLMGLLDVSDAGLLVPVLERLIDLVEEGKKPNRMLLIQRLTALTHRTDDDAIAALVEKLRARLG